MRLAALMLVVGCVATFDDPRPSDPPPGQSPLTESERAWSEDAFPVFQKNCVTCHGGTDKNIAFLAGSSALEVRATLLSSGLVDLDEPVTNSPLLVKGPHSGPPLTAAETSAILSWLVAERAN